MAEIVYGSINTIKLVKEESNTLRDAVVVGAGSGSGIPNNIVAAIISGIHLRARNAMRYVKGKPVGEGLPVTYIGYSVGNPENEIRFESDLDLDQTVFLERYEEDFLPLGLIRKDLNFINEETDSEAYKQQRQIFRKLKLNLNEITAKLTTRIDPDPNVPDEPNPDLQYLDDAFFLFATDIYSEVEASLGYMFEFLENLRTISPIDKARYEEMINTWDSSTGLIDQEERYNAFTFHTYENQYEHKLSWNYIERDDAPGNLGLKPSGARIRFSKDIELLEPTEYVIAGEDIGGEPPPPETVYVEESFMRVRKANDDGTVTSLTFHGPRSIKYIHGVEGFKTVPLVLSEDYIGLELTDDAYGKSGFHFPIQYGLYASSRFIDKEAMLNDAMMLSLHTLQVEHLAWYQTGWFKTLMTIVAILLTAISLGSASSITVLIMELAKSIVLGYVISYTLELLIGALGLEATIAIAVLATIVAIKTGTLKGDLFELPYADEVLEVTNAVSQSTQAAANIQQDEWDAFQKEAAPEIEELKNNIEELKAEMQAYKEDNFNDGKGISVDTVIKSQEVYLVEEATAYFKRTLQLDANKVSLDAVANFVSSALELPNEDITPEVFIEV